MNLMTDGSFSDVSFILEDGSVIKAHKAILASRCEVFKSMLTSAMKEGTKDEIEIKDTNAEVFRNIISYIYTDEVDLTDLSMIINLLIESNKYNLTRLKNM